MELQQKKNQEGNWTQEQQKNYLSIVNNSQLPIFKLIKDLQAGECQNHEVFYVYFVEKSDYAKSLEKSQKEGNNSLMKQCEKELQQLIQQEGKLPSNNTLKNKSIHKQPIRIQLLVNSIIKGNKGDKNVDKQWAFQQLFQGMKNGHIMQFLGEGFYELYHISVYKCQVSDDIHDHLIKKQVYIAKDLDTVLFFKHESLTLRQECFNDFFLPQDENFKYYSISDFLKKSTQKLYEKGQYLLNNHNNEDLNPSGGIYDGLLDDLFINITPDLAEKLEYDNKIASNQRYKLELCHYFKKNQCSNKMNSVKCKFAHGEIELRQDLEEMKSQKDSQQMQQLDYQQLQYQKSLQKKQKHRKMEDKLTDLGYINSDDINSDSFFASSSCQSLDGSDTETFRSQKQYNRRMRNLQMENFNIDISSARTGKKMSKQSVMYIVKQQQTLQTDTNTNNNSTFVDDESNNNTSVNNSFSVISGNNNNKKQFYSTNFQKDLNILSNLNMQQNFFNQSQQSILAEGVNMSQRTNLSSTPSRQSTSSNQGKKKDIDASEYNVSMFC